MTVLYSEYHNNLLVILVIGLVDFGLRTLYWFKASPQLILHRIIDFIMVEFFLDFFGD